MQTQIIKIQHTHLSPRCRAYNFNKTVPETKFNTVNIFNNFETSYRKGEVDIINPKKSTLKFSMV